MDAADAALELYRSGMSTTQVAKAAGRSTSTVGGWVRRAGIMRPRAESVRLAGAEGRLGSGTRGKSRQFSESHKHSISVGRKRWSAAHACGVSIKPNGYIEYTVGEHKGRSVHVVLMERRIGRRLLPDETVHHIDGNRANNDDDNLALCTRAGHARLHKRERKLLTQAKEH